MRMLPSAIENDIGGFCASLNPVQEILGDHFAPGAGGDERSRARTWRGSCGSSRRRRLRASGKAHGGSAGFAFVESEDAAMKLIEAAKVKAAGLVGPFLDIPIARAINHGARVTA
jgi:beta-ribofuranosylaminobenzene 5'-phosphate synthase